MVFPERFMDSYPYEMGQLPYVHCPYHSCFGSGPEMKVEQPRVCGGYPSQCHHGCCNLGYFRGPGSRAAYPSKTVRTIEVKDMSKADQNKNARGKKGSLNSVGADNVPIKVQIKEKKPNKVVDVKMKKKFSDEEAALLVQSVYRGYDVRKLELLNKLKKIANIRELAAGLEGRIQSLVTLPCGPIDEKQRLVLEETIMSLFLKLDDVQGLPAQYREIRKSAARELTKMQERLDALTSQKLEDVKEEEISEPVEQCMDSNTEELKEADGNDGTEVECGNERCEENYLQHPNDEAARGCEVEAAELSFSVNSELAECEEVDDTDHTCPKSVGLDNEIPSDAQLESDGSVLRTKGEGECHVGVSLSSTEAPVNEEFSEARVESGGTRIDSESAVVTPSSPEPSVSENDTPNGTGVESDAVEPETRVESEVLDGTFSSPVPVEQGEVEGTMIESGEKLMKENEELRKLTEKLIEVTKEQSAVIYDLNRRVDNLEKKLSAKQNAMKNIRRE